MTTENNKLIAEFMGWNIQNYNELPNNFWYTIREIDFDVDDGYRFHNSWDWLMPVINKIRSMDSTYEVEEVGKYDWDNEISHYEFDLDLTYQSVLKFIKEYSNN